MRHAFQFLATVMLLALASPLHAAGGMASAVSADGSVVVGYGITFNSNQQAFRWTQSGGVARPSEEIMQLVPLDDDLLIEAKIKSSDIAFVKTGLPATIKLDAYDYTIYGTLPGDVVYISADTLSEENQQNEAPYYRVQVKAKAGGLKGRGDETIHIQPGMTATVEIKTGSNTVLRYLTKPITKTLSESLGER